MCVGALDPSDGLVPLEGTSRRGRRVLSRRNAHHPGQGRSSRADRIEQALTNLITNAIQYGASSSIRVESIASAAEIVAIRVHNGGAVIPADVLPELFKAYRRGIRGDASSHGSGLGLGLFIVAQIVAAHGGRAYAESSAKDGTTFTIEIPREAGKKGP